MSVTTKYTKAEAKASDRTLGELTTALNTAENNLQAARGTLHRRLGHRRTRNSWPVGTEEPLAAAQAKADNPDTHRRNVYHDAINGYTDADNACKKALAAVLDHSHHWRDHGRWSRFFLVEGGHIHAATSCQSLRPTTRIGWLPELSGETEKDAVDARGTILCTFCFPSAPVEWTLGKQADDPAVCPGSGQYVPHVNMRLVHRYGACPECGDTVSVTSLVKARKHNRPQEAK